MKLATCGQMRKMDKEAIEKYGIPGVILMENAALSVFDICRGLDVYTGKKAVIFCGGGNNGGDGFALARHMINDGVSVAVVLVCEPEKISGDAKKNYDICVKIKTNIYRFSKENIELIKKLASETGLIVDAILGTGVKGELKSHVAEAVSIINGSGKFVLAIDCPTGGNPDNGQVTGVCVRAGLTVSLALVKPGLLLYPLADYTGVLKIGEIGAPISLLESFDGGMYSITKETAAKLLPRRKKRSHKGTFGKVALVAGGRGMAGAAAFCAKAAYKAGCGYVCLCAPEGVTTIIQQLEPQAVITPLPEKDGFVYAGSAEAALEKINGSSVCLIGPGLGNTRDTRDFVRLIVENANVPLIIDADALNALSDEPQIIKNAKYPPVVTPHPLEMSRLTRLPVSDILSDTVKIAKSFSERYNAVTVLKDAATVVCGEGKIFINSGACSSLAKAGSGDILAGIIAGLIAQGLSSLHASALAVFIHCKSGAAAAKKHGDYSVASADIIECMGEVFKELGIMKMS